MQTLSLQSVLERLQAPAPTCILFHAHPDADAIGSAFALKLALAQMGSPAYCLCADEIPDRLRFLTEGMQESVLLSSLPCGFENARVVTVDSASPSQLGDLYEHFGERISLMIDHHAKGEPYADHLIVANAAATGEIICDLAAEAGIECSERFAELLYAAISADTGCFRYSNTTAETHLRVAALVKSGIDTARINHLLLETKSIEQLKAEHAAFDRLHFYADGRVAIVCFPYALKTELGVRDEHLETLVDVARRVRGVEIAAAIRQPGEEPIFRVSTRSSVDFDVSAVCAEFGGGGHVRAAGATIREAESIEQAEALVANAILQKLN